MVDRKPGAVKIGHVQAGDVGGALGLGFSGAGFLQAGRPGAPPARRWRPWPPPGGTRAPARTKETARCAVGRRATFLFQVQFKRPWTLPDRNGGDDRTKRDGFAPEGDPMGRPARREAMQYDVSSSAAVPPDGAAILPEAAPRWQLAVNFTRSRVEKGSEIGRLTRW